MLISFFLLGGLALMIGSICNSSNDEVDDEPEPQESEFRDEREDAPDMLTYIGPSDADLDLHEEQITLGEFNDFNDDMAQSESAEMPLSELAVESETASTEPSESSSTPTAKVISLDISMANSGSTLSPLEDFSRSSSLPVLNMNESEDGGDDVYIELPLEQGGLSVVQADYYERTGFEDEEDLHILHTGANVYYVPIGETFPSDVEWSESGATLRHSEGESLDSSDFGGIRLVARIDTGTIYDQLDSPRWSSYSDESFFQLQENLHSNGSIVFKS